MTFHIPNKNWTMTIHRVSLFSLLLSHAFSCHNPDELGRNEIILHDEIEQSITTTTIGLIDRSFLRRKLQSTAQSPVSCRAVNPMNVYICGGSVEGDKNESCIDSDVNCAEELGDYECTCNDSNETSCSYCRIRTADAILCQVTGSSTTFVDQNFALRTCSCDYMGNGHVIQICYPPTSRPTTMPLGQMPTENRAPSRPAPAPTTIVVPVEQPTSNISSPATPVTAPTKTQLRPSFTDSP